MRRLVGIVGGMLAACGSDAPPEPGTRVVEAAMFPAAPVRKLDLLFQLDNSANVAQYHPSLARAIPSLLAQLSSGGELPDLHVAVITSDLGTSGSNDPSQPAPSFGTLNAGGCHEQGEDGRFRTVAAMRETFLADGPGAVGRVRNFDGELADVLGMLVRVGNGGCGFEQPLSATRRALTRETGFLRPDAALAVVIAADEDDCSVSDVAVLRADAPLGPLQSLRCARYGLVCDQPLDEVGVKTGCQPWTESTFIEDPYKTVVFLRERKPPERLVVGTIVGPSEPFEIVFVRPLPNAEPTLLLNASCRWTDGMFTEAAAPGPRLVNFAASFGSRGVPTSICSYELGPQVTQIGLAIKRSLGVACIDTSTLADASSADGIQPSCEVRDVLSSDPEQTVAVPQCPADGDCWQLVDDPVRCAETADHARVDIMRTSSPSAGTRVEVRCEAPLAD